MGSNVVVTGSGSINTAGLTLVIASQPTGAGIDANDFGGGDVGVGPASFTANAYYLSSIPDLGPGTSSTIASSGSGDGVEFCNGCNPLRVAQEYIYLPTGYTSGAYLSGTSTYADTTIADLGLTPGSYSITWGSGAIADSATANIQSPAPEPGSLCLLGLGGAALLLGCWRKRSGRG